PDVRTSQRQNLQNLHASTLCPLRWNGGPKTRPEMRGVPDPTLRLSWTTREVAAKFDANRKTAICYTKFGVFAPGGGQFLRRRGELSCQYSLGNSSVQRGPPHDLYYRNDWAYR